jgi:hypothetical protein
MMGIILPRPSTTKKFKFKELNYLKTSFKILDNLIPALSS